MKEGKRFLAAYMAAILLLGSVPLFVFGANTGATDIAREVDELLDFSKSGSVSVIERAGTDFLSEATGIEFTDAEKSYFDSCGICLRYSDDIPPELVSYVKTENGFKVKAAKYTYLAKNGETVIWNPVSVTVDGVKKALGEERTASFTGLTENVVYEIAVEYETELAFSKEALNDAVNAGFDEGSEVLKIRAAYEAKLAEYEGKLAEYERAYRAYLTENNRYIEYLRQVELYEKNRAAYLEYLSKKENYERGLVLWQNYLRDLDAYDRAIEEYRKKNAEYELLLAEYEENRQALSVCLRSLEPLESVFVRDLAGHVMYNTLKGDTVAQVVQNQDKLVEWGGVSRKDVTNAGSATERLIAVLTPYAKLKTIKEKFEYYKSNYEEIKSQFILLYSSLNSLCQNGVVRSQLQKKGKLERYYQFISQLYVISTCLDDQTSFSPDWLIRGNSVYDLLDECQIVKDTNKASPLELTCPQELPAPEKPVKPSLPERVEEPVKDWVENLTEPTAPEPVSQPKTPEKFGEVLPESPVFTAEQWALAEEIEKGILKERKAERAYLLTAASTVVRKASFSNHVTVTFYDCDRKTVLYDTQVPIGEKVEYNGKPPARASDGRYTYIFSGWVDEQGNPASLDGIIKDCCFYAVYTSTPVKYTVIFNLHDRRITAEFGYGEMPVCDKPAPYIENGYKYSFSGWSPALTLVTGNAEYTALYNKKAGSYTVVFEARGVKTEYIFEAGEVPTPPPVEDLYIENGYLYEFVGWAPEILPVLENAFYSAEYKKEAIAPFEDGIAANVIERETLFETECPCGGRVYVGKAAALAKDRDKGLYVSFKGAGGLLFTGEALSVLEDTLYLEVRNKDGEIFIGFFDGEKKAVLPEQGIKAVLVLDGVNTANVEVYEKTESGEKPFPYAEKEQGMELTLSEDTRLVLKVRRVIDLKCEGNGYISTEKRSAVEGEEILLGIHAETGCKLKELYLETNGKRQVLSGNRFVMPAGQVTVYAVFEKIEYTVIFLDANGGELSRTVYFYGDMPVPPETPAGRTDGEQSFVFSHWDPEVGAVMRDVIYRPVFTEGKKGDYDNAYVSPYDSNRLFTIVLPIALTVAVGTSVAVIAVIVHRNRRKKNPQRF